MPIGPPGPPRKLGHTILDKQMGIKLEWQHPKRLRNSFLADLTYKLKLCQLVPFDAIVQEFRKVPDPDDRDSVESILVWKKVNVTVEKYKPADCRAQITRYVTLRLFYRPYQLKAV